MGRPLRSAAGGVVYHVLNRANGRAPIFDDEADYAAFLRILASAQDRVRMRLLAYCVMPNHWHLVVWPRRDGDLSRLAGWLPGAVYGCIRYSEALGLKSLGTGSPLKTG